MSAPFKNSEGAFAEYLDRIGWQWQYETPHGAWNPDFTITTRAGSHMAVIEVEDCYETDVDRDIRKALEETGSDCRGYDPYVHIERAIKNASKQVQGVDSSLPCMVVVADTLNRPACETAVLGAMFGALSISVNMGDPETEPKVVFGKGGKMVDAPPAGDRGATYLTENRRLGAVAYFKLKPVQALRAGYYADREEIMDHYVDRLEDAIGAFDQMHRGYQIQGISPAAVEPCLEIYINPLSPVPWPADLHGPFDQVWARSRETAMFEMVFDGISEPPGRPIKKSDTQKAIEDIMSLEDLRNE